MNLIDKDTWILDPEIKFVSYTAEWCKPCCRIKPKIFEFLSKYEHIETEVIDKKFFKENVNNLVPFFEIHKNDQIITTQTSDFDIFKGFFNIILKEKKKIEKKMTSNK